MKKLMVAITMCIAAAVASAAQCEGKTLQGERCKREPAEGSKFCIGHADQAKKPAAKKPEAKKPEAKQSEAKLKDDGTCWAMTEKGTRCKHKKDGEKDYCKMHAADLKPAKPFAQCRALTYEGKQCPRKPLDGMRYCAQHSK